MNICNFFTKYFKYIVLLLILFLIFSLVRTCNGNSDLKTKLNISEQNIKALNDSVRVSKNKVGDLEFSKNILVSEKSDLKNLNGDLKKELDKEKGKVFELTTMIISIKKKPNDTIRVPTNILIYPDGSNGLSWTYDKEYDKLNSRHIAGVSKFKIDTTTFKITPLETLLTKDEINFNIVQGLREKDGNIEMFVRSDYPDFSVKDLNTVIIDPKTNPILKKFTTQKRFGFGPYIGYGVYINNFNGTIGLGANIGLGIHYDLFKF